MFCVNQFTFCTEILTIFPLIITLFISSTAVQRGKLRYALNKLWCRQQFIGKLRLHLYSEDARCDLHPHQSRKRPRIACISTGRHTGESEKADTGSTVDLHVSKSYCVYRSFQLRMQIISPNKKRWHRTSEY